MQQGALVNGEQVGTSAGVVVIDPSTGDELATTADCGAEEVDQAVRAAREALKTWRLTAPSERAALLRALSALILREVEPLAILEARQTGKPLRQARRDTEITARYFDFYASAIETFYGTTIPLGENVHVYTTWEPHGVTAHVIPWNYPLQILGRSVAAALAMGNCCVLKPAEEAPLTALRVAELALEAGFPSGTFNVVTGYGETTGAALTNHPGVDHISFTGSVEVGRIISHAAAEHLIPVTMELGGKSPNIVFADADMDRTVPIVVNAILQNAGQTCSAGSRLLVQESIHDELVDLIEKRFAATSIGAALDDPDLGPLISEVQRERVLGYTEWAHRNATVRFGGHALTGGTYGRGFFVEPTLIDNVDPASPLGQEEVFGPVLAVTSFATIDDAIELANGTDYGLIAGVWTTNISTALRMSRDIEAGQVFVNTYGASGGVELPFGGFKRSGHGREKGAEGLRGFGQVKTSVLAL
ncbi:MAG TPA: aldehyde dehydrogenase family protein [Mycobacterium sp.]|nr:aldehyde dehydrogenase family protein [Mycobacterium sp.]